MNLQEINNILIVAPHADDEVLGCGGIIKKFSKLGKNVFVIIMTNAFVGEPKVYSESAVAHTRNEALRSHQILGVKETFFADFPAPRLDTFPVYQIATYLLDLLRDYQIDTMFIPHRGDIHLDHKRIYEACLVAARPQGTYTVKQIYSYETLSETEWAAPFPEDNFIPNVFINIEEELQYKIEAFEQFQSQIKIFPHPRSPKGIKVLAEHRGSVVSVNAAEAFSLIRQIFN